MAAPNAFVTLVTSDRYLPGALAQVAAIADLHPKDAHEPHEHFQTVCLVTPETVDVSTIKALRGAFNVVVGVEIIEQEDDKGLRLLGERFPPYRLRKRFDGLGPRMSRHIRHPSVFWASLAILGAS